MASKRKTHVFHVAVVGMSGPTRVRGDLGVGKSCLCNRFVRPDEDEFHANHASTLSQSDFGGRVINNDQFLYWGEVTKDYGGVDIKYRVIEHTEFIDDASFSVFKGSFDANYFKRSAETRLHSPEKVAFVCRDQLGDEESFPRQVIPKGKFHIDGFLLVFDVSEVRGRSITAQRDFVEHLHSAIIRTNKPIVLVASKCDAVCDTNLNQLKQFARHKKLVMTECSANLGVNVDSPFFKLASMITKKLPQAKSVTYHEALAKRSKWLDTLSERYEKLLGATVADHTVTWKVVEEQMKGNVDYREYVKLAGTLAAKRKFTRHITKMKPEYENVNLRIQKCYFMPESTVEDNTFHEERLKASHCNRVSCAGLSSHAMDTLERSATVPRQSTLRKKLPVRPRKPCQQARESENYYDVTNETSTRSARYMKDISRMYTIKNTGLCHRWMGTMTMHDGSRKCVVLTAIKVKNDLHWDQFVKRSLDLPSTDHIAEVMGIGFIEGELNLVQEHFVCETLDSRLAKARHDGKQMSVSEIITHITGIVEGMELLHAFGFLHPGLSTRKILLTMRGVCKLYDFCLAEDAAKVASLRKTKMPFSLNHFAPEVLRCGEYTKDSDVWSTGVVVYEILTGDKQPFPAEYKLNAVATTSLPKCTAQYPELRNGTLWRCWTEAASLRPTMNQLRTTYKKVFDSLGQDEYDYEIPDVDAYLTIDDDEGKSSYGRIC